VVGHAFRHGVHPEHTERLAAFWAEALGGPTTYSDVYGDQTSVVRIHSGNGLHEEPSSATTRACQARARRSRPSFPPAASYTVGMTQGPPGSEPRGRGRRRGGARRRESAGADTTRTTIDPLGATSNVRAPAVTRERTRPCRCCP